MCLKQKGENLEQWPQIGYFYVNDTAVKEETSVRGKNFHFQETPDCRYYWWYPIKDSEHPQFCYLYQQCAAQDSEPEVGWAIAKKNCRKIMDKFSFLFRWLSSWEGGTQAITS